MELMFNNKIPDYDALIKQLESLKEEALYMMKSPGVDEIFNKDFHALKIAISIIKEIRGKE